MKKIKAFILKIWKNHYVAIILSIWFIIWTFIGLGISWRWYEENVMNEEKYEYLLEVTTDVFNQGGQNLYEVPDNVKMEKDATTIRVKYKYVSGCMAEGKMENGVFICYIKPNVGDVVYRTLTYIMLANANGYWVLRFIVFVPDWYEMLKKKLSKIKDI